MNHNNRETIHLDDISSEPATGALMLSSNTLVGNKVCNRGHENVGDIKDFMLDTTSGKIEYAVLSFGSFLGMGEKLFAVPFRALTLDTENKRFILDVDKQRLKEAPGFDKDHWPDMADQIWARSIHNYYGAEYQPDKASN
jgi:sporulation protein YlmC with PRC-barrel domain